MVSLGDLSATSITARLANGLLSVMPWLNSQMVDAAVLGFFAGRAIDGVLAGHLGDSPCPGDICDRASPALAIDLLDGVEYCWPRIHRGTCSPALVDSLYSLRQEAVALIDPARTRFKRIADYSCFA